MTRVPDKTVTSRKTGAENIIMINVPADRFRHRIPSRYDPPVDHRSRYRIALLAQACEGYSFDYTEAGPACEFHFWFWVASSNVCTPVKGADILLASMNWWSLASATNNGTVRKYLQSFGFRPLNLEKIDLQKQGGLLSFPDGGRIDWTVVRAGKEPAAVGVNHAFFTATDGPGASGHRVTALLTDAVMEQPGKIHIQTTALEPFLLKGERFPAAIHQVPRLEADVIWQQYQ